MINMNNFLFESTTRNLGESQYIDLPVKRKSLTQKSIETRSRYYFLQKDMNRGFRIEKVKLYDLPQLKTFLPNDIDVVFKSSGLQSAITDNSPELGYGKDYYIHLLYERQFISQKIDNLSNLLTKLYELKIEGLSEVENLFPESGKNEKYIKMLSKYLYNESDIEKTKKFLFSGVNSESLNIIEKDLNREKQNLHNIKMRIKYYEDFVSVKMIISENYDKLISYVYKDNLDEFSELMKESIYYNLVNIITTDSNSKNLEQIHSYLSKFYKNNESLFNINTINLIFQNQNNQRNPGVYDIENLNKKLNLLYSYLYDNKLVNKTVLKNFNKAKVLTIDTKNNLYNIIINNPQSLVFLFDNTSLSDVIKKEIKKNIFKLSNFQKNDISDERISKLKKDIVTLENELENIKKSKDPNKNDLIHKNNVATRQAKRQLFNINNIKNIKQDPYKSYEFLSISKTLEILGLRETNLNILRSIGIISSKISNKVNDKINHILSNINEKIFASELDLLPFNLKNYKSNSQKYSVSPTYYVKKFLSEEDINRILKVKESYEDYFKEIKEPLSKGEIFPRKTYNFYDKAQKTLKFTEQTLEQFKKLYDESEKQKRNRLKTINSLIDDMNIEELSMKESYVLDNIRDAFNNKSTGLNKYQYVLNDLNEDEDIIYFSLLFIFYVINVQRRNIFDSLQNSEKILENKRSSKKDKQNAEKTIELCNSLLVKLDTIYEFSDSEFYNNTTQKILRSFSDYIRDVYNVDNSKEVYYNITDKLLSLLSNTGVHYSNKVYIPKVYTEKNNLNTDFNNLRTLIKKYSTKLKTINEQYKDHDNEGIERAEEIVKRSKKVKSLMYEFKSKYQQYHNSLAEIIKEVNSKLNKKFFDITDLNFFDGDDYGNRVFLTIKELFDTNNKHHSLNYNLISEDLNSKLNNNKESINPLKNNVSRDNILINPFVFSVESIRENNNFILNYHFEWTKYNISNLNTSKEISKKVQFEDILQILENRIVYLNERLIRLTRNTKSNNILNLSIKPTKEYENYFISMISSMLFELHFYLYNNLFGLVNNKFSTIENSKKVESLRSLCLNAYQSYDMKFENLLSGNILSERLKNDSLKNEKINLIEIISDKLPSIISDINKYTENYEDIMIPVDKLINSTKNLRDETFTPDEIEKIIQNLYLKQTKYEINKQNIEQHLIEYDSMDEVGYDSFINTFKNLLTPKEVKDFERIEKQVYGCKKRIEISKDDKEIANLRKRIRSLLKKSPFTYKIGHVKNILDLLLPIDKIINLNFYKNWKKDLLNEKELLTKLINDKSEENEEESYYDYDEDKFDKTEWKLNKVNENISHCQKMISLLNNEVDNYNNNKLENNTKRISQLLREYNHNNQILTKINFYLNGNINLIKTPFDKTILPLLRTIVKDFAKENYDLDKIIWFINDLFPSLNNDFANDKEINQILPGLISKQEAILQKHFNGSNPIDIDDRFYIKLTNYLKVSNAYNLMDRKILLSLEGLSDLITFEDYVEFYRKISSNVSEYMVEFEDIILNSHKTNFNTRYDVETIDIEQASLTEIESEDIINDYSNYLNSLNEIDDLINCNKMITYAISNVSGSGLIRNVIKLLNSDVENKIAILQLATGIDFNEKYENLDINELKNTEFYKNINSSLNGLNSYKNKNEFNKELFSETINIIKEFVYEFVNSGKTETEVLSEFINELSLNFTNNRNRLNILFNILLNNENSLIDEIYEKYENIINISKDNINKIKNIYNSKITNINTEIFLLNKVINDKKDTADIKELNSLNDNLNKLNEFKNRKLDERNEKILEYENNIKLNIPEKSVLIKNVRIKQEEFSNIDFLNQEDITSGLLRSLSKKLQAASNDKIFSVDDELIDEVLNQTGVDYIDKHNNKISNKISKELKYKIIEFIQTHYLTSNRIKANTYSSLPLYDIGKSEKSVLSYQKSYKELDVILSALANMIKETDSLFASLENLYPNIIRNLHQDIEKNTYNLNNDIDDLSSLMVLLSVLETVSLENNEENKQANNIHKKEYIKLLVEYWDFINEFAKKFYELKPKKDVDYNEFYNKNNIENLLNDKTLYEIIDNDNNVVYNVPIAVLLYGLYVRQLNKNQKIDDFIYSKDATKLYNLILSYQNGSGDKNEKYKIKQLKDLIDSLKHSQISKRESVESNTEKDKIKFLKEIEEIELEWDEIKSNVSYKNNLDNSQIIKLSDDLREKIENVYNNFSNELRLFYTVLDEDIKDKVNQSKQNIYSYFKKDDVLSISLEDLENEYYDRVLSLEYSVRDIDQELKNLLDSYKQKKQKPLDESLYRFLDNNFISEKKNDYVNIFKKFDEEKSNTLEDIDAFILRNTQSVRDYWKIKNIININQDDTKDHGYVFEYNYSEILDDPEKDYERLTRIIDNLDINNDDFMKLYRDKRIRLYNEPERKERDIVYYPNLLNMGNINSILDKINPSLATKKINEISSNSINSNDIENLIEQFFPKKVDKEELGVEYVIINNDSYSTDTLNVIANYCKSISPKPSVIDLLLKNSISYVKKFAQDKLKSAKNLSQKIYNNQALNQYSYDLMTSIITYGKSKHIVLDERYKRFLKKEWNNDPELDKKIKDLYDIIGYDANTLYKEAISIKQAILNSKDDEEELTKITPMMAVRCEIVNTIYQRIQKNKQELLNNLNTRFEQVLSGKSQGTTINTFFDLYKTFLEGYIVKDQEKIQNIQNIQTQIDKLNKIKNEQNEEKIDELLKEKNNIISEMKPNIKTQIEKFNSSETFTNICKYYLQSIFDDFRNIEEISSIDFLSHTALNKNILFQTIGLTDKGIKVLYKKEMKFTNDCYVRDFGETIELDIENYTFSINKSKSNKIIVDIDTAKNNLKNLVKNFSLNEKGGIEFMDVSYDFLDDDIVKKLKSSRKIASKELSSNYDDDNVVSNNLNENIESLNNLLNEYNNINNIAQIISQIESLQEESDLIAKQIKDLDIKIKDSDDDNIINLYKIQLESLISEKIKINDKIDNQEFKLKRKTLEDKDKIISSLRKKEKEIEKILSSIAFNANVLISKQKDGTLYNKLNTVFDKYNVSKQIIQISKKYFTILPEENEFIVLKTEESHEKLLSKNSDNKYGLILFNAFEDSYSEIIENYLKIRYKESIDKEEILNISNKISSFIDGYNIIENDSKNDTKLQLYETINGESVSLNQSIVSDRFLNIFDSKYKIIKKINIDVKEKIKQNISYDDLENELSDLFDELIKDYEQDVPNLNMKDTDLQSWEDKFNLSTDSVNITETDIQRNNDNIKNKINDIINIKQNEDILFSNITGKSYFYDFSNTLAELYGQCHENIENIININKLHLEYKKEKQNFLKTNSVTNIIDNILMVQDDSKHMIDNIEKYKNLLLEKEELIQIYRDGLNKIKHKGSGLELNQISQEDIERKNIFNRIVNLNSELNLINNVFGIEDKLQIYVFDNLKNIISKYLKLSYDKRKELNSIEISTEVYKVFKNFVLSYLNQSNIVEYKRNDFNLFESSIRKLFEEMMNVIFSNLSKTSKVNNNFADKNLLNKIDKKIASFNLQYDYKFEDIDLFETLNLKNLMDIIKENENFDNSDLLNQFISSNFSNKHLNIISDKQVKTKLSEIMKYVIEAHKTSQKNKNKILEVIDNFIQKNNINERFENLSKVKSSNIKEVERYFKNNTMNLLITLVQSIENVVNVSIDNTESNINLFIKNLRKDEELITLQIDKFKKIEDIKIGGLNEPFFADTEEVKNYLLYKNKYLELSQRRQKIENDLKILQNKYSQDLSVLEKRKVKALLTRKTNELTSISDDIKNTNLVMNDLQLGLGILSLDSVYSLQLSEKEKKLDKIKKISFDNFKVINQIKDINVFSEIFVHKNYETYIVDYLFDIYKINNEEYLLPSYIYDLYEILNNFLDLTNYSIEKSDINEFIKFISVTSNDLVNIIAKLNNVENNIEAIKSLELIDLYTGEAENNKNLLDRINNLRKEINESNLHKLFIEFFTKSNIIKIIKPILEQTYNTLNDEASIIRRKISKKKNRNNNSIIDDMTELRIKLSSEKLNIENMKKIGEAWKVANKAWVESGKIGPQPAPEGFKNASDLMVARSRADAHIQRLEASIFDKEVELYSIDDSIDIEQYSKDDIENYINYKNSVLKIDQIITSIQEKIYNIENNTKESDFTGVKTLTVEKLDYEDKISKFQDKPQYNNLVNAWKTYIESIDFSLEILEKTKKSYEAALNSLQSRKQEFENILLELSEDVQDNNPIIEIAETRGKIFVNLDNLIEKKENINNLEKIIELQYYKKYKEIKIFELYNSKYQISDVNAKQLTDDTINASKAIIDNKIKNNTYVAILLNKLKYYNASINIINLFKEIRDICSHDRILDYINSNDDLRKNYEKDTLKLQTMIKEYNDIQKELGISDNENGLIQTYSQKLIDHNLDDDRILDSESDFSKIMKIAKDLANINIPEDTEIIIDKDKLIDNREKFINVSNNIFDYFKKVFENVYEFFIVKFNVLIIEELITRKINTATKIREIEDGFNSLNTSNEELLELIEKLRNDEYSKEFNNIDDIISQYNQYYNKPSKDGKNKHIISNTSFEILSSCFKCDTINNMINEKEDKSSNTKFMQLIKDVIIHYSELQDDKALNNKFNNLFNQYDTIVDIYLEELTNYDYSENISYTFDNIMKISKPTNALLKILDNKISEKIKDLSKDNYNIEQEYSAFVQYLFGNDKDNEGLINIAKNEKKKDINEQIAKMRSSLIENNETKDIKANWTSYLEKINDNIKENKEVYKKLLVVEDYFNDFTLEDYIKMKKQTLADIRMGLKVTIMSQQDSRDTPEASDKASQTDVASTAGSRHVGSRQAPRSGARGGVGGYQDQIKQLEVDNLEEELETKENDLKNLEKQISLTNDQSKKDEMIVRKQIMINNIEILKNKLNKMYKDIGII